MNTVLQRPRHEVEQRAQEILDTYGPVTVPIDSLSVAREAGIKVFNAAFPDPTVSGLIRKKSTDVSIYIKETDAHVRKRFTIAHELGHFFLHLTGKDGGFIDDDMNLRRAPNEVGTDNYHREVEANQFAAAFLMPEEFIRAEWNVSGSIVRMARLFEVSIAAMEIRLKALGIV